MSAVHAAAPTRWGFHRLDPRWARALVSAAAVGAGDLVLDIGAGDGALTHALAATGARVIAVELHGPRCAALRQRFEHTPNVRVVRADAGQLRLPRRPFRVVANPPFAASAALVRRLARHGSMLERADLVLPRTQARRWERAPLGAFDARLERGLPRGATTPAAPMDLAVLVVRRRDRRRATSA